MREFGSLRSLVLEKPDSWPTKGNLFEARELLRNVNPDGGLLRGVIYLVPAIITIKGTTGDIATGQAFRAVRVRRVRECIHAWTLAGSGGLW